MLVQHHLMATLNVEIQVVSTTSYGELFPLSVKALNCLNNSHCNLNIVLSFGAKIRSRDLGVIYNDQLFDAMNPWVNEYNLEPDSLMPQKRPMSLSCPTIMLGNKGNVRMVIGAAGGRYIASALAQVSWCLVSILTLEYFALSN